MTDRKYRFDWELIGDLELGRPNLGPQTRLEIYRLMQFTLRDVLEKSLGAEQTDVLFYRAGYLAGSELFNNVLNQDDDPGADSQKPETGGLEAAGLNAFIARLQSVMRDMGIGILRVEKADLRTGELVVTVSEDLDCSGLPELDDEICVYDEGLIAGLLESYSGLKFKVKEVDCWCTGDRTCRFLARVVN